MLLQAIAKTWPVCAVDAVLDDFVCNRLQIQIGRCHRRRNLCNQLQIAQLAQRPIQNCNRLQTIANTSFARLTNQQLVAVRVLGTDWDGTDRAAGADASKPSTRSSMTSFAIDCKSKLVGVTAAKISAINCKSPSWRSSRVRIAIDCKRSPTRPLPG